MLTTVFLVVVLLAIGVHILGYRWLRTHYVAPVTAYIIEFGRQVPLEAHIMTQVCVEDYLLAEEMHRLSGGVAASLVFAGVVGSAAQLAIPGIQVFLSITALACLLAGSTIWLFPKLAGPLVLALGGMTLGAILSCFLTLDPGTITHIIAYWLMELLEFSSVATAVYAGSCISLILAVLWAVPLGPTAGGKMLEVLMNEYFPETAEHLRWKTKTLILGVFFILVLTELLSAWVL